MSARLFLCLVAVYSPVVLSAQTDHFAGEESKSLRRAMTANPPISFSAETIIQNRSTSSGGMPASASSRGFGSTLTYFLGSTFSARTFLETGLIAGIPNLPTAPKQPVTTSYSGPAYETAMDQYGDGMDEWRRSSDVELRYRGRRAAAGLATAESRVFLSNLLLPLALRENARYVPADLHASFASRIGHAAASAFVTRGNNGHILPNFSKIGGTVGAAFLGRKVFADEFNVPQLDTGKFVGKYIGYSLAGDMATNISREFVRSLVRNEILIGERQGPSLADSYYPMTAQAKLVYWARSTYSLRNFVQGALLAGIPNVTDEPEYPATPDIQTEQDEENYDNQLKAYGVSVQSWRDNLENDARYHGRRLLAGFSESETQLFLSNFALAAPLRMDPRYVPLGPDHSAGARLGHALAGVVVAHRDNGHDFVNFPIIGGTVGAAYIGQQYIYPQLGVDRLDRDEVLGRTIGLNLAADALFNVVREILPRRTF
jgi:hypothetical protein